jgi:hypothetical protein
MKKQIKTILATILGIIAVSLLFGCASGPNFGQPTPIQQELNKLASAVPINIAGQRIFLSFEGDFWRGRLNGKDAFAGDCKIDENDDGAIITLNQTLICLDSGKTVPVTGEPVLTWQKTSGPEIVLEYKKGPPATLSKFDSTDDADDVVDE